MSGHPKVSKLRSGQVSPTPVPGQRPTARAATPTRARLPDSPARLYLRRKLEAHLDELGYTFDRRISRVGSPAAEIARVSPVRSRLVYGETVLRSDLRDRRCRERLLFFSARRTRRRSLILFFIGVDERCLPQLEALLVDLGIRSAVRGGHVFTVSIPVPRPVQRR